jgi:uncharacterized repeat protein (TIGR01451 family)
MRNSTRNKASVLNRVVFAVVALALFWITMAPFSAEAALQGSAGNTIIRNTVTVNYKDNGGTAQAAVTSTIDLTVTTVAAAPTVLSFSPVSGTTDGTGATQSFNVVIRTNSNGPGAITFGTADTCPGSNIACGAAPTVPASIFLGSTVIDPTDPQIGSSPTIAAGGPITFRIPNDGGVPTDGATTGGATGDSVVNALKNGDTVYIYSGGVYYGTFLVGTVTDNAVGAGTTAAYSTIQLTNNSGFPITLTNIAYGWEILEAKTVQVTVTQGTVTDPTNPASWVTTITGDMGGQKGTGTVTTNASAGKLAVQKYVRNVTVPVAGGGLTLVNPPINNTVTYYQTIVSGKPGDIMEYAVKITNTGTGNATAVIATDPVPTYSTLVSSSAAYGANNGGGATGTFAQVYSSRTGTTGSLKIDGTPGLSNVGYGNSSGQTAGSTMNFYLGFGSANGTGGRLDTLEVDYIVYQIKID